ncbi:MAG: hypothetical protein EBU72_14455 [Betaproteobacteria bacterium]|nr:hypothetical protein [Betaproteobacteria bacterium]
MSLHSSSPQGAFIRFGKSPFKGCTAVQARAKGPQVNQRRTRAPRAGRRRQGQAPRSLQPVMVMR